MPYCCLPPAFTQVAPLSAGLLAFCAALAGYFLLLPLRDEAGVALGTDKLPRCGAFFLKCMQTCTQDLPCTAPRPQLAVS